MGGQVDIDPAIRAITAGCSIRLQRVITDALNAELDQVRKEGYAGVIASGAAVSAIAATLFSTIISRFPLETQAGVFGDTVRSVAQTLALHRIEQEMKPRGVLQ